jgi:hypothetical protein
MAAIFLAILDIHTAFNANIYKGKIIKNSAGLVWLRCLPYIMARSKL